MAGGRFGAQNSYGPECLCTIAKRVKEYPLPIHLDAMEKSTAEVEALEESVLYREKMVGFEEPVVQAAAKEKKELVNAYKQLCGVLQTGNVQDWMHTMAELAQGASKWKSLPEEMHDEAFSVLRKALMAKEVKAEDLFACTGELQKIETRDPALLQKLLQAAGLLEQSGVKTNILASGESSPSGGSSPVSRGISTLLSLPIKEKISFRRLSS